MVYSEAEQAAIFDLFPTPPFDNAVGFHGSSGGAQHHAGTAWDNWGYDVLLAYYRDRHDRYGIRWWKFLGDGSEGSVMYAKAIKDAGIEPILRLYKPAPHWWFVIDWNTVAAYVAVGCRYIEYGNEPNLGLEVSGVGEGNAVIGHGHVVSLCNQFIANTTEIVKGGGICLIPAMSPGAILDDTGEVVCHQSFIKWFQNAIFDDGTRAWDWFVGHCKAGHIAVAVHPRGGNHVVVRANGDVDLDYPLDPVNQTGEPMSVEDATFHGIDEPTRQIINAQRMRDKTPGATLLTDSTSYQSWELVDDLFREALGFSLPLLATEAGPEIYELWDGRYPRTTLQAHSMISMELVRRMNPIHPKAARRALFCLCFWVHDNEGHGSFMGAGWVHNQMTGADLPALAALEQFTRTESFVRTWGTQPEPEPIPEPEPTPTPAYKWRVCDATGKQLGVYNNDANALNRAVVAHGYVQAWSDPKLVMGNSEELELLRQTLAFKIAESDGLQARIDRIRTVIDG